MKTPPADWGPVLSSKRVRVEPIDSRLARGMGLARESVELLIAWAWSQPGVRAITARVERDNVASQRLLTHLGFTGDGQDREMRRFVLHNVA